MSVPPGWIVLLNGAPRSGKSSLVQEVQRQAGVPWINLGVDASMRAMLPAAFYPGIGLRPGGERPDLEPLVQKLYAALFASIAAHSREGLNVISEFGIHEDYSRPLDIWNEGCRRLEGLPLLTVGVHCDLGEVMRRRALPTEPGRIYEQGNKDEVPAPVLRWQQAVHEGKQYGLEVDTTRTPAAELAQVILKAVRD